MPIFSVVLATFHVLEDDTGVILEIHTIHNSL